jgi:hypothetical protein
MRGKVELSRILATHLSAFYSKCQSFLTNPRNVCGKIWQRSSYTFGLLGDGEEVEPERPCAAEQRPELQLEPLCKRQKLWDLKNMLDGDVCTLKTGLPALRRSSMESGLYAQGGTNPPL